MKQERMPGAQTADLSTNNATPTTSRVLRIYVLAARGEQGTELPRKNWQRISMESLYESSSILRS